MTPSSFFKIFFILFFVSKSYSQTLSPISQTLSPCMVTDIKIGLKATSSATTTVGNKHVIKVSPEILVSLKNINNISRIHLEILEKDSLTVAYKTSYNINSSIVMQAGTKLFERNNTEVFFSTPSTLTRDKYFYKVYTEDGAGNLSKEFIQKK